MGFQPPFKVGSVVKHEEMYKAFKCANMGGMRYSSATETLVLLLDHTRHLYNDNWRGDILYYTGTGKKGDQILSGANKRLAQSRTTDLTVHLFEVFKTDAYTYCGEVELAGEPYQEVQDDEEDHPRKVWIFPLRHVQ
ncbi:HNH endonuclease [Megasphaera hominis]|jgi:5-methylcytosine-specific restriction protein A|uniref:HNH endonuclease n=1 Tax=Megasphaera hominis TaxID=159836 RepID=A0ABR6VJT6_9FIRM|nr:HNH endonuclease [Megasphaera hominis]MBC3537557.1 HNH endonuclease [Megasphaera hominis]